MKTILNVKTEKSLKEEAQATAKELGLPLSVVVNAFLKQFVRDREVTFSSSYKPSQYLKNLITEIERDIEKGENLSPEFDNIDDAVLWLNS